MTFVLTLSVTIFALLHSGLGLSTDFSLIGSENCIICPQDVDTPRNLTYQCTVIGTPITRWSGTAFNCPGSGDEILLLHSDFSIGGGTSRDCNDGGIVGQSVRVEGNDCFTSQLRVSYTRSLLGQTIVCSNGDGDDIGNSTIETTTDPVPPPDRISLSRILSGPPLQLTFNWTTSALDCQRVKYHISSNCDGCSSSAVVVTPTFACTDVHLNGRMCSFSVGTSVCDNINSAQDSDLFLWLKAPDAPTITDIVPTYSYETGQLSAIEVTFTEPGSFNITNEVSGAATSYTLTYSHIASGATCDTQTLPASSCLDDGTCTQTLDVASSPCGRSARLNVAVSATNVLGEGEMSTPTITPVIRNNFVNVSLNLTSSAIVCSFQNQVTTNTAIKTCTLTYYRSDDCNARPPTSTDFSQTSRSSSNEIQVGVPFVSDLLDSSYCFVITANDGSRTTVVQGTLNRGCNPNLLYEGRTLSPASDALCDPPLKSIAVEDGFACYSGTFVGATATHHCRECSQLRSVRYCQDDGSWSGRELQCNCPDPATITDTSLLPIILGVLVPIVLILLIVIILFLIAYCVLHSQRRETSTQVNLLQARVTELSTVYEDLDNNEHMETIDNRAYKTVPPASSKLKELGEIPLPDVAYDVCRNSDD